METKENTTFTYSSTEEIVETDEQNNLLEVELHHITVDLNDYSFSRPVEEVEFNLPNYTHFLEKLNHVVDLQLDRNLVYLTLNFNSLGGSIDTLESMIQDFKRLKDYGITTHINISGDCFSAGVFLLYYLAKHKLCYFTFPALTSCLLGVHQARTRVYTNEVVDQKTYSNKTLEKLETTNKNLLDLICSITPLTDDEIEDYNKGRDIFVPMSSLEDYCIKNNLIFENIKFTTEN